MLTMGMLRMTPSEEIGFEYRNRYERVCSRDMLNWTTEGRWIGRLLMAEPDGMSIRMLARVTGISRTTVRRRVDKLVRGKAARVTRGRVHMTDAGHAYWVTLHREIDAIANGHKTGLSHPLVAALRASKLLNAQQISHLETVSFPLLVPKK